MLHCPLDQVKVLVQNRGGIPDRSRLRFRRAREMLIQRGNWTQISTLALKGWQLSRM